MAYMEFDIAESGPKAAARTRTRPIADDSAAFEPLEWTVIALARHDRPRGLRAPSGVGRLLTLLFGGELGQPLANRRLEALRRVAVLAWHGREVSDEEAGQFLKAGFNWAQLGQIRTQVAAITGRPA